MATKVIDSKEDELDLAVKLRNVLLEMPKTSFTGQLMDVISTNATELLRGDFDA
ncbi:hypothetical protein QBL02_13195 [Leucobacter sp. UT-8R-CII-1-4]|uniref:hypothetical protein n=1 Tax=Leucobacter sp. UT-8R-CII-1-4 TaxID=3040075 RepID=UPI0024A92CAC|nr:hypothetical protein [Leucobacter sp. UT-8R-CII-1-4]MDI6024497.1 hypothetical protein [Leucobacter sp. UT-8R-CII-1-4]